MKTLAIFGAGHLGQQIAHYAITDGHYDKVCYFDDYSIESHIGQYDVLGGQNTLIDSFAKGDYDEIIIGIGYKHLKQRKNAYAFVKENKIPLGKLIHSTSWVDPTAIVEEGSIVYPSCSVDAHAVIRANCVLNIGCVIAHDSTIGMHCFLSPRVAIAGFVRIDERCIIGINATIIDNINICSGVQLGGGAVVIKNIDHTGLYVGNPSRLVRIFE
jgi:sugar O-acyltransferase (sialic acid O-acetyltransferase NeuD family)|tara:strand:+ start:1483 stop:2124 length:642 start_codon:yes stop_codon:yes gene_type:complete